MLGIELIVPLFSHSLDSDLRRIAHSQFKVELGQQALEPTRVPGGLDPHAYADAFFLKFAIQLLSFPTLVPAAVLCPLRLPYSPGRFVVRLGSNRILRRGKLAEPLVDRHFQVYSGIQGANDLCNQLTSQPVGSRDIRKKDNEYGDRKAERP